ncbi:UNVERIFIED_CONTAM: hypothetical protein PYX00_001005 [Menopon gallinae]|uniref:Ubiquitin carboxyl-terminal hydrolase n=1 Tax=Menopon gallinae TaxID=328185 RepID=A0AAW2IC18_9NEOP
MPVYKVKIKWGKEQYNDVEANTDEDPLVFKAQLFALTGVHPNRQKIMVKGSTLKDWSTVNLKDGCTMLLMGSKEEDVPQEPSAKPTFMEDMTENELATALDLPAGLINLGNTCYMNATVQCLKTVPELREALQKYTGMVQLIGQEGMLPAQSITAALRDLYALMDKGSSVHPILLLQVLHIAFPAFAEKSEHGGFQQQDANECWSEMIRMLQLKLPSKDNNGKSSEFKSFIDQFFGGTFVYEMKCTESDEEMVTQGKEDFLQLSCFISADVKYMLSGLKNKLQEQITKQSPTLGRDAVYMKTSKISRLPAYLTIQFVRFFYKEKRSINAKILKDIKFPIEFDAFELCTSELQEKLTPMRLRFKELEDAQIEETLKHKKQEKPKEETKKCKTKSEPYWFPDDLGSNSSGYYTLQAVLTHKGRSSTSGHYVAWIKQKGNVWLKCDDDVVSPVTEEDVLKLSGGGDWHCAYVLLYGPKILEIPLPSDESTNISAVTQ